MSGTWLPPVQYVAQLPKATVYGCFLITDQEDRPVQLRSVRNPANWQWPGGNMDPGETPWECAVREGLEETGLEIARTPRLLGVRYLMPRPDWPAHKIGLIFDGGRLTPEQIAAIVLDPAEHDEVRVRSLEEWRDELTDAAFQHLAAAVQARRDGIPCYLEQTETS
ncbi:NUDIX domain-containing protein [Streptomyces sp. MI02-7b]|uniref:NUDIX domain-containing protein n=1 Tax=Streptomyces sp. MI02-7b TaxID=462941 RepID=UPI0029B8C45C|nr:NUDIX domain-containing protein [Streptomyces sp. MI02-7b]MDX3071144.1 NUDIX domain-containing protein [Streptomyces sp. MI02-7b]